MTTNANEPFSVVVVFENRPDGGLRVYSDDVPGLVLSHSDPNAVHKDIVPALEGIISEMIGKPVKVTLASQRDQRVLNGGPLKNPVSGIERREYIANLAA